MTKFMQKIIFFVSVVSFSSVVSAHNWPFFSTIEVDGYITLDVAFNEEAGYEDEIYGYDIDLTSPLLGLVNQYIENPVLPIMLTPMRDVSDENEMLYNIIFNNSNVGAINMSRTLLNPETLVEYKTRHELMREAKRQLLETASEVFHMVKPIIVEVVQNEGKSFERRAKHWKKKYKF